MAEQKIVLKSDAEAATLRTVTGWVSRDGKFFGTAEDIARYTGCTHVLCECGASVEKSWIKCPDCRSKLQRARYDALPKEEWDGSGMICIFDDDKYFSDMEEAEEFAAESQCTLDDLMLVICEPKRAYALSPEDVYSDLIPEDEDVPAAIEAAFKVLNEAIEKCTQPLCYFPGKIAVKL